MTELAKITTSLVPESILDAAHSSANLAQEKLEQLGSGDCAGGEMTGWYDYPSRSGNQLSEEVAAFKNNLTIDFDCVVVIGIGGSYLGTRAAHHALSGEWGAYSNGKIKPIFYAGHHLAARSHEQLLKLLEERNPIINVISKSGTTTEPSIAFRLIRELMARKYSDEEIKKRIVVTTDAEKGALRELSNNWGLESFVVPSDIGGRFSVLTAVSLVPLALAGADVCKMMQGADSMFSSLSKSTTNSPHPATEYACLRHALWSNGAKIEVFAYNEPELMYLAEWWKQLFGESEGKNAKGLFPASLQLTTDLHSLGQYLQDGERTLCETFVSFADSALYSGLKVPKMPDNGDQLAYLEGRSLGEINDKASKATAIAHSEGGVPCIDLSFAGKPDEYGLGAAFAFYESACGVSALLLGVNPFDQPGVEAYKLKMFSLLGKPGF